MRNSTRCSSVNTHMHRLPLFLVCSLAVMAQPSPQQDPMDTAIQTVWEARSDGRFDEAAAARERARALLQRMPVDSPRFAGWVQRVAQLYGISSLNAQAGAILQESLTRTVPLGNSHPSHIAMLSALGDFWRRDGNLLKAVEYLEKATAAEAGAQRVGVSGNGAPRDLYASGKYLGIVAYNQLADLYQQLGRPDAVAAIGVKIRVHASNGETELAQFYERHGQLEEAAAIYKKLAEQSADPQAKTDGWQALANLDARQERYTDAIAATQQAIAAAQSSDDSGIRSQALYQNLARYMGQAGLLDQADQVYQQLLQRNQAGPQQTQVLDMYARYLADTRRGAQGESLLKDYLADSSSLDPNQKTSFLFCLADLARRTGNFQSADEYQRAGQALQPQPHAPPLGQLRIAEELREAQTAVNEHRLDDGYAMALDALDVAAAGPAADGRVEWFVPQIAQTLAANKDSARAERLFRRVFALAQTWSVESMQPLLVVAQHYPRFLMSQPDHLDAVPAAIEQYRSLLIDANGPDSASLTEPLQMKIELERSLLQWEKAEASAHELLELQESLSGDTSGPYLRDLRMATGVYDAAGDTARALPLLRKAITVADLLATPNNDWWRAETRMDAALALAHLGQFDEAEALGEEAVALERPPRTPRPPLEQQLKQIRWMKEAAEK
jgi:tetratricopeptide (TPR) repeat protein